MSEQEKEKEPNDKDTDTNNKLREQVEKLQTLNNQLLAQYSQTMSFFDDAIYNLSTVYHNRKLSNILQIQNENSSDNV